MTKPILSSNTDPFLTTKEAARRLGVTLRTVQLWVEAGKLHAARTPGGHRRILASDVQALQERMGIKPAKAVVMLTPEQITAALAEAGEMLQGDYAQVIRAVSVIQAALLAANGLEVPHA